MKKVILLKFMLFSVLCNHLISDDLSGLRLIVPTAPEADLIIVPREVSRTSGVAPLSVHFSAGFKSSSVSERSFHNFLYSW